MQTCVPNHGKTEAPQKTPQLKVMTSRHRKKPPWEGGRFGGLYVRLELHGANTTGLCQGCLSRNNTEKKKEEK